MSLSLINRRDVQGMPPVEMTRAISCAPVVNGLRSNFLTARAGRATPSSVGSKLDVLRIENGVIAEITTFGAEPFPAFGLPPTL